MAEDIDSYFEKMKEIIASFKIIFVFLLSKSLNDHMLL